MKLGRFEVDEARTELVFEKLAQAMKNKTHIFSRNDLRAHMKSPANLDALEERLRFFNVNVLDGNTDSTRLWNQAKYLIEHDCDFIISSKKLAYASHDSIKDFLKYSMGVGCFNAKAKYLKGISKKLIKEYDGDPLNIFDKPEQIVKRLNEFPGYGDQLPYALVTYFRFAGFIDKEITKNIPPKVDRYKKKFPFMTGMLHSNERALPKNAIEKDIEEFYIRYANGNGLDQHDYGEGIWDIGSEVCSKVSHNVIGQYSRINCKQFCPVENICTGLIATPDKGRLHGDVIKRSTLYLDVKYPQHEALDLKFW